MRAPTRLLPALTALGLTGTLLGGGAAAADLRADARRAQEEQRRIAAAEAEARAEQDYRAAVTSLAAELYAQAQPFLRAMDDATDADLLGLDVLEDVSQVLVDDKPFDDLHARLSELTAPKALYTAHLQMQSGLKDYADAADLAAGVAGQKDAEDAIEALVTSDRALANATRTWRTPVDTLFAGRLAPPVPDRAGDPVARPSNQASYLYDAGAVCAASLAAYVERVEGRLEDDAFVAKASFDVLRERLPALIAVPVPESDAGPLRDTILAPLEDARSSSEQVASLLDTALAGRASAAQLRETETLLTRGQVAAERAAAGFRDYGSATCAGFLVGFEDAEDATAGDPEVERPT